MRRDLHRRLSQLETVMRMPSGCEVVRILGGLPDMDDHAWAGALRFQQEPDESREVFEDRVIETAEAAGERLVVFGGLPDMSPM
jgi:hypothetical protein